MVRLVEVVLEPGKRTYPPLATPAGASRLRCVPPPRLHRGGGAGGITPLQGTPADHSNSAVIWLLHNCRVPLLSPSRMSTLRTARINASLELQSP